MLNLYTLSCNLQQGFDENNFAWNLEVSQSGKKIIRQTTSRIETEFFYYKNIYL